MTRRALLTTSLAISGTALAGCQSAPRDARDQAVAMAMLAPTADHDVESSVYHLGAGDALGQDIFVVYVASIMAERGPVYATGEDGAPSAD